MGFCVLTVSGHGEWFKSEGVEAGYLLDRTVSGRIQNSEYTVFSSGHGPPALHICRVSMCSRAHDGLLIEPTVKG